MQEKSFDFEIFFQKVIDNETNMWYDVNKVKENETWC